jgi:hypothetical protein
MNGEPISAEFIGYALAAVVAGAPARFKLTKAVHHG